MVVLFHERCRGISLFQRDAGDVIVFEISKHLSTHGAARPAPRRAFSLAQEQTSSAQNHYQDKQYNELFAIHFADVLRRLTPAITMPEAVTAAGTSRMLIHLIRVC